MLGPVVVKQSRWAGTSQYLAIQAVPLLASAVIAHSFGWIETHILFYLLGLTGIMAVAALILSVVSLWSIWSDGDIGTGKALTGLILGAIVIAPFLVAGSMVLALPKLNDVATRYSPPMAFDAIHSLRSTKMNLLSPADLPLITRQFDIYPAIAARQFSVAPEPLFTVLRQLVTSRGWQIIEAVAPDGTLAGGKIEAIAFSPVLAIPNAILIETQFSNNRTRVDMRAAAMWAEHDLGGNVGRVQDFFLQLETEVRGIREEDVTIYDEEIIAETIPLNIPRPRPQ